MSENVTFGLVRRVEKFNGNVRKGNFKSDSACNFCEIRPSRGMHGQKSSTKDLDLPKPKPSSKTINLVKGDTSEKQVLSPVAARGIEVKKNVNNRSQASSRPQRKLDLDGRLRSWKEEVE